MARARSLIIAAILGVSMLSPFGDGVQASRLVNICSGGSPGSPLAAPSPRRGMGMANDAVNAEVVLFGGWDGIRHFNDTWTWDGTSWNQVLPAHAPSPRRTVAMAYDAARREVVLFGGFNGSSYYGDTWIWDGEDWTERQPVHAPDPAFYAMAFDASSRQMVITGGPMFETDTWVWDGADWSSTNPEGSPEWRQLQGMSRDGQHVVMFGGEEEGFEAFWTIRETWSWDGRRWHQRRPLVRPSKREVMGMAYDVVRDQVVLFGGANYDPLGDTWSWDGLTWTKLHPAPSPPPRERMGMAYDSRRGKIVLFGGTQYFDECFFGDTWTWDGTTWTER